MEALNWKLRISVLWLIAAEAMSAHMINGDDRPGHR